MRIDNFKSCLERPLKSLAALMFAISSAAGQAAPFLVCDPYPADKPQPDVFLVTVGTAPPISVPASKDANGSVALKWDLASIGTGAKTVTVKAKSAWGESADSAPFSFTPGVPVTPGRIGLSVN